MLSSPSSSENVFGEKKNASRRGRKKKKLSESIPRDICWPVGIPQLPQRERERERLTQLSCSLFEERREGRLRSPEAPPSARGETIPGNPQLC
jgi:hypothetical protein